MAAVRAVLVDPFFQSVRDRTFLAAHLRDDDGGGSEALLEVLDFDAFETDAYRSPPRPPRVRMRLLRAADGFEIVAASLDAPEAMVEGGAVPGARVFGVPLAGKAVVFGVVAGTGRSVPLTRGDVLPHIEWLQSAPASCL